MHEYLPQTCFGATWRIETLKKFMGKTFLSTCHTKTKWCPQITEPSINNQLFTINRANLMFYSGSTVIGVKLYNRYCSSSITGSKYSTSQKNLCKCIKKELNKYIVLLEKKGLKLNNDKSHLKKSGNNRAKENGRTKMENF